MNKTIIININGMVFHIEEDAYEMLKNYMTDVKRHFLNSADSLEITTDIENRIAEMFNEILAKDSKQVIVEADVQLVIEQMGSVKDFEESDDDAKNHTYNIYGNNSGGKKLFRDPDDHLIGGVCAGIANYFDIEAVWVRLAFFLAFLVGGTGLILYIILLIVIPKAATRADRMAMKGEKRDLQGFKNSFEEEINAIRNNIADLHNDARPAIYKVRDFTGDFFHHFGVFLGVAGKLLAKFIAIIVLVACFAALIALVVAVIAFLASGNMGLYHLFPFNIVRHQENIIFLIGGFLILAIPLLSVILVIISAVFSTASFGRATGTTLLLIWLAALGAVIYYAARDTANFRYSASFSQNINIKPTLNNTYYLKLNDVKYLTGEDSIRLRIKDRFKGTIILNDDDNNDTDPSESVSIRIEKSDLPQPVLVESFSARGSDYENALINARNCTYVFAQEDSVLKFDRRVEKPTERYWRDQEVHLTLKVPVNAKIVIDQNIENYMQDIDEYNCKMLNKQKDETYSVFTMSKDGIQCKVDTLNPDTLKIIKKK